METIQEPMLQKEADASSPLKMARYVSIDAFRALTLLLMIFVNDFGTLRHIPEWLKHTEAAEDGMGFSDIIFPAFLFIVGLSVPIAIQHRMKRNSSVSQTTGHILLRSLALLIMGVFHVNLGNYSQEAWLSRPVWEILITVSFFLIWLDYSREGNKRFKTGLQVLGVLLLGVLAIIYKGNSANGIVWMQPKWWGILGLIGWSYLLCSLTFLWTGGKFWAQVGAFIFFMFFNAATNLGWLAPLNEIREYVWIIGDGSMPAMVMAGVITTMVYTQRSTTFRQFFLYACIVSLVLIAYGFATRPVFEISKIRATPSWVAICTGISLLSFAILAFLTDVKGKDGWYRLIKPAGISTLTCYLLPYIHDAILGLVPYRLPIWLRTAEVGLLKSMIFSLLIISIVGLLQKYRIRLKL